MNIFEKMGYCCPKNDAILGLKYGNNFRLFSKVRNIFQNVLFRLTLKINKSEDICL